jgi:hypothetical protein
MKLILAMLLALMSGLSQAGEFYIGGAISAGRLRYDVDGWVQHQLDKNNLREEIALFERAGGTVTYEKQLTSPSHKIFVGYQQSDRLSYEFGYRNYGPFSLRADANASGEVFSWQGTVKGKPAELSITAAAHEGGEVTAAATGLGASALYFVKPLFFRLGIETISAAVEQTSVEEYNITATGSYAGRAAAYVYGAQKRNIEIKRERIILPLLGIGAEFPIDKNLAWRAEIEHVGVLKQGFDFYSLSVVYKF